ncbi:hypothetical protein [cf. Phormidesmis sp. LEGE 11477]|uniref:hypothetical protein n=1 Tax=cf. Phormidesmis sp. LEGE 11477 TaxID=1828680 RepID=UPI0018824F53|nr:hypothetical protein [cf. Phormidesmis sp. LEGE 11477]MBE9064732.1 hypothetical protein [cf. Phormidesmis sp. LEGE 11477]
MAENNAAIQTGSLITVTYEDREFEAIVIDPNGLGDGEPSIGFGFRMASRHIGIPQQTLTNRVTQIEGVEALKVPSGKVFRVTQIRATDGNDYKVIEVADWFDLSMDILLNPGKIRKPARENIGAFLRWFAIKGFYAEANVALKGVYSGKSSRATTRWLIQRQSGKPVRKTYTDLLLELNVHSTAYGKWTNEVYKGLFGMPAVEMKQRWLLMSGDPKIARNYISEEEGIAAVKYCEDMVVRMYIDNLEEAHREAIALTVRKYKLHPQFSNH